MASGRPRCSKRWQCALAGGAPGWLADLVLAAEAGDVSVTLLSVLGVPLLCGLFAGYLWDGGLRESAIVGGLAGGVSALPKILFALLSLLLAFIFQGHMVALLFLDGAVLFLAAAVAGVVLGAIGGVLWALYSDGGRTSEDTGGSASAVDGWRDGPDQGQDGQQWSAQEVAIQREATRQGSVRQRTEDGTAAGADRADRSGTGDGEDCAGGSTSERRE